MTRIETDIVHESSPSDPHTGALVPAIQPATTFRQERVGEHLGWEYSRTGNPTRAAIEKAIAHLEGGRRGFAFSSGSAALDTLLHVLQKGDHVVAAEETYGGTRRILDHAYAGLGVKVTYVGTNRPEDWRKALGKKARLAILESPSNPLLNLTDLREVSKLAHEAEALVCVDNTFATPYLQQPLSLGADVVFHSATKYLGGHSDVLGGLVVVKDAELAERIGFLQNAVGAVSSPWDAWLILRGMKTLHLRMDASCRSAAIMAAELERNKRVAQVFYPGLKSHPDHELAARQMRRPGAMLSFEVKGAPDAAAKLLRSVGSLTLAESLGSVETLLCHPFSMTHASIPESARRRLGITPNLIRVSVGIEHPEDLLLDLGKLLEPDGPGHDGARVVPSGPAVRNP